jgi:hypothetical protein
MALWPAYMTLAGLLALAGIAKLRSPATAGATLTAMGLRGTGARVRALVRAVGAGELALACACVAAPGRLPAAVLAAAYLAFGSAVLRLRAARAGGGCGCFGDTSAPAGLWHFALNLAAAAVALAAVAAPPPGWGAVADHPGHLAVALAGVVTAVALGKLAFTAFPAAWGAYRADAGVGAAR